jgi:uncharacterized protein YegL
MPMDKPIIFISHIHEDAQIALCLKRFLDEAFLGVFTIFVSSDGASIRAGENWSSSIEDALSRAELVLALISEQAKDRRWIYFECGGAYFARKRVIPICCRRFTIPELCAPLSWLQAIDGADIKSVEKLVTDIATAFELHAPEAEFSNLVRYLGGIPCEQNSGRADATFSAFAQTALPIFLVVDTSGSMFGEPIENLSKGIRKLIDELLRLSTLEVAPLLSLITFGTHAEEVFPLSPITSQSLNFSLTPSGTTALGEAMHLLALKLADRALLPQRHFKPIILIFTDGSPTDDWKPGLKALNQTRLGESAIKICVGLGSNPDFDVLKAIAGDSVVSLPDTASVQGLAKFFAWMSNSVRRSAETNQENIQLADLSEWGIS